MAKMFDKVTDSFLQSIKSVMEKKLTPAEMKKREEVAKAIERDNPDMPMPKKMAIATATAKKVAEAKLDPVDHKALKGSHADRKDKDIDNDGDSDKTDEYLHNRRKAIKQAMAKKMKEAKEYQAPTKDEIKKDKDREAGKGDRMYGALRPKLNLKKEEAEQIDEISTKLATDYSAKAADARGHRNLSTAKLDKRHKSMALAHEKIRARHAKVPTTEEVEQIDELSPELLSRAQHAASARAIAAPGAEYKKDHERAHKFLAAKNVARERDRLKSAAGRVNASNLNKEEAGQIDELSKRTLGSYVKKAAGSAAGVAAAAAGRAAITGKAGDYDRRALRNRLKGISKAADKLAKEEANLTPEEIEMIEAKMAGVADGALPGDEHMCATKVFHKEWKEGTPVPTMHADPDADGLIEWYDVMFDHGIERVMTEDMEIVSEMSHGHKKRGMTKEDQDFIDSLNDEMFEEVEQIDETAKVVAHLQKRYGDNIRKSHVRSAANDFGVGYVALSHAVRKKLGVNRLEEEQVDEARGRPKKAGQMDYTVHPKTKEKLMHNNPTHMKRIENLYRIGTLKRPKTEAGQNIVTQLRKASTSMTGGMKVNFTHGAAKHVSADHARKLLDKHADMKPAEKEAFQKKIGHSHEEMKKHV